MDIVRLSTRQPITISVGVLFCLLAGVVALQVVPVQMTPEVEDTIIAVTTNWENASPQDVESEIIDPQEEKLQGLSNLKSISSVSSSGSGVIRLEFNSGVGKESALREVSDKLREVPSYPENVDEPVIEATDPESQDYIAWYIFSSEDDSFDIQTLLDFAEDRIKPQLERVPGISEVNVLGGREREVQIRFDPTKLAQHGVAVADFVDALTDANQNISGGALEQGKTDVRIRTVGRFSSVDQILKTVLRRDENGIVYVADVAVVEETFKEQLSFVRANGVNALAFNFQREPDSNVLDVMRHLESKVGTLHISGGLLDAQARELGLNGKLRMELSYRSTNYINQALSLVKNNIYIGGSLAIVVLLLFLRSVRSVGIIALSIPVSIMGAIVMMVALGRSINVVSLAGMAFAVGMVVDNCIVILENMYSHLEQGKGRLEAAYDGTKEVAGAVLASTLTTIVVFIPILMISDQVGQLFRDIALAIILSVGFSYVVAITVIPSAGALLLHQNGKKKQIASSKPLMYRIVYFINGSFLMKLAVILFFIGVTVVGTIQLIPPLDYLPKGNRNITFGLMVPPPGHHLDRLRELGQRVEKTIRPYWEDAPNRPPIELPFSESGETVQPSSLNKYFLVGQSGILFHGAISEDSQKAVDNIALFQKATAPTVLPGIDAFAFQFPLFRIGGTTGSAIKINLVGNDLDRISSSTGALFGSLLPVFGPRTLRPDPVNFNVNSQELRIIPDSLKLSELSMSVEELGQVVQSVSDGIVLGDYDFSGDLIDLKLIAKNSANFNQLSSLPNIPVVSADGDIVSLQKLGEFQWIDAADQIKRVGRQRAISLELTPPNDVSLEQAVETIERTVADLRSSGAISPGVSIDIEGTAGKLQDIRQTLFGDGSLSGLAGSSFFLAICAVYLLMCVLFQSWIQPLIIMVSVPLATFGGLVGLAILHDWSLSHRYIPTQNLDMLTILGFFILIGVVVNNAILIVAQTNHLLHDAEHGSGHHTALSAQEAIALAVQSRVRPTFMSMLTSVGGMTPLVLIPGSGSELYRGLGAVMVGGMLLSTVFTLVLIPALLSLMMGFTQQLKRLRTLATTTSSLGILMTITSCKSTGTADVENDFVPPEKWTIQSTANAEGDLSEWWRQFDDPVLTELIDKARQRNLDIAIGLERVARSRVLVEREKSTRYPGGRIGGEYTRNQYSESIKNNFRSIEQISNWDLFMGVTWEMDFFGRIRESINAATSEYQATTEDFYNLHVMISADLAQQYVLYRSLQEQESLTESGINLLQENFSLVKAKFKAGAADELDVNNAHEQLILEQVKLTQLQMQRQQTLNQICLLSGAVPGALDSTLAGRHPLSGPTMHISVGIPADFLRRRPDIRSAEHRVAAEASRLKIARAEYYPKFTLTGDIGLNSTYFNRLARNESKRYNFGPSFEWRILSSLYIKKEVKAQQFRLREALSNYRKTVLQALEEVESNLIGFDNAQQRFTQLNTAVASAIKSMTIAETLYVNGLSDYQSVIEAILNMHDKQQQIILTRESISRSLVRLYQSLGGGWKVEE